MKKFIIDQRGTLDLDTISKLRQDFQDTLKRIRAKIAKAKAIVKSAGDLFEERMKAKYKKKIIRENERIRRADGSIFREIDFETDEAIVEVGISLSGKAGQLQDLAEIAKQRGKRLDILYGKDTSPGTVKAFKKSLELRYGNRVRFIPEE